MRRFLLQIVVFSSIVFTCLLLMLYCVDGYSDPFYLRFTTPKQSSLLLGTSRSAQGLVPKVFKEVFDQDFFNYSFTIGHSPYGPVYLESIKRKLDKNEKNGFFIIAIDPWSISSTSTNPNDSTKYRELNRCLDNTYFVNMNPNIFYLFENLSGNYYKLLFPKKKNVFLHDDGWLEVSVPMDSIRVNKRVIKKMKMYRQRNLPIFKFSSFRLTYLEKTIAFLKKHGEVYLVRLPVHPEMMKIENELMFDFNDKIQMIVPLADGYYDMTKLKDEFRFTDGNHLYKESAILVSEKIVFWIKKNKPSG